MIKICVLLGLGLFAGFLSDSQGYAEDVTPDIKFSPINHATMVIQAYGTTIYLDPVGSVDAFKDFPRPDIILITDIHFDHLAPDIVKALKQEETTVIGPKAVVEELGSGEILNSGENKTYGKVGIEAIPAYNLTPERMQYHEKGRGNGYVLTLNNKRVYISGDTEDIPDMRGLENIDYAFICMNLPYTMTVEQAASAVLEFKPKVAFPYHHRGSDVEKFKQSVSENKEIEVRLLKWY
ncbi:MAG: MBL fold metallo-hydrolase [Candidatus Omnitrophota bacterium]